MINLFPQKADSIPFFLQKEVLTITVDTVPVNEFLAHQFLPLDTLNLSYKVDAFNHDAVFAELPAMIRPFMAQYSSILFLVFTFCFVLTALVFSKSGRALASNFGFIFSAGNRNKNISESVTTSDAWGHIFFIFQTLLLYSIFFFDLALKEITVFTFTSEYLMLFGIIFAALFVYAFIKYVVYKAIGALLLETNSNDIIDVYLWILYLSGVLTFIPLLFYFYVPEVKLYALILIIGIFIIGRVIIAFKAYSLFLKYHIGILYFFVYLCAIEIMPYFIIYKAIIFIQ